MPSRAKFPDGLSRLVLPCLIQIPGKDLFYPMHSILSIHPAWLAGQSHEHNILESLSCLLGLD